MTRHPYTRCEGLYPWFIYKNLGNGAFATDVTIKYQPVPLESDTGDSAILSHVVASQSHAVMDVDGDGILDAIARPRGSDNAISFLWNVWLGDGTGGFSPKRYIFPTRNGPNNQVSGFGTTWGVVSGSSEGLLDVNGDGLPDHWLTPNVWNLANANIAFHDGTQHRLFGQSGAPATGEVATPASPSIVKPGNDAVAAGVVFDPPGSQSIISGTSTTSNRVVDVDGDGRVDVLGSVTGTPQVFYNLGGQFRATAAPLVGDGAGHHLQGYRRQIVALGSPGSPGLPLTWELKSDLIDLDGNGIPESVSFPDAATMRRAQHDASAPPRLMKKIINNRGAETTIAYASMHEPGVVERTGGPGGGPSVQGPNQWVVKSMTVEDKIPTVVASTTTYKYTNPFVGPDDEQRNAFRGFAEVTTTGPSGAKVVQRYSYGPDWSGRPTAKLVFPAEAPTTVRTIDKTTWEERQLFGGAVKTYHATLAEHFVCANGQTETTCTPSAAPGYTRTTTTLTALASTTQPGAPLAWAETSSLLQAGTVNADGDRETVMTFAFKADVVGGTTSYRLRPLTTVRNHRAGGTMTLFGKSATTWDADFLVPLTSEVWFDANDANRAIARSVYDMATGNVIQRFKPKQNAAGTTSTTLTYDSRKLFATTVVNELGHQVDTTFEYGTGTKLQTDGPNTRGCTTGCPTGATYPVKEQHKVRVDGLGRPIEQWDTTSDDGNIYMLYLRATTSYVDAYSAPTPPSVTSQTRLDSTSSVWAQEKTELDGHGRPSRKIAFAQGAAPADHVTSFAYRSDGTLQTVKVPDPTANDASVVTYSYTFDSLGRLTSIRRPDAVSALDQSGVDSLRRADDDDDRIYRRGRRQRRADDHAPAAWSRSTSAPILRRSRSPSTRTDRTTSSRR